MGFFLMLSAFFTTVLFIQALVLWAENERLRDEIDRLRRNANELPD
jgi:hypothetical protein